MKQGLIKGLLMLSIMNCLITACSKEDPDSNGLAKNASFYSFPEAEPGTTLYDGTGPQWQNKPFEAQWVVNNQVVGNTRVEFVWAIPVTNHIMVTSYPNEIVFDWLIKMSGTNVPEIKDAESNHYCFEYKGKSDNCQYYEYSEEFMGKMGGRNSGYGVYINDEHYIVDFVFAELPTATYDRENEIFILHLKVSGLLLSWYHKDYTREYTNYQYSQPLEMTLVTTKSLPYSY